MPQFHCTTPVQLRFSDFDSLGHLNNSVYFQLFDLGKSDYFNHVRGENIDWHHVPVMIVNVNCNFQSQTYFNETIAINTRTCRIGNKSFTLTQQLVNTATGEVKCSCDTVMVYIDLECGQPAPIPADWRHDLAAFEHLQDAPQSSCGQ